MGMLTEGQMFILNTISKYMEENEMSPTVRELCRITDIKSTATIYGYLKRLENKGYIHKKDKTARSIKVTDKLYKESRVIEEH